MGIHPAPSSLDLRQPLILAEHLKGWRKPDLEDNPPKLPSSLWQNTDVGLTEPLAASYRCRVLVRSDSFFSTKISI